MIRALLAAVLLTSAGCSLVPPAFECDDTNWEPGQTCQRVLEAARGELPPTGQIVRLTAGQAIFCPPSAGCPFTPFVVTLYADLIDGRQLYVSVDLEHDGSLRARPAEIVQPAR